MSQNDDWFRKQIAENPGVTADLLPQIPQNNPRQIELSRATPAFSQYYAEPAETLTSEDPFFKVLEYWHICCQHKIKIVCIILLGALAGLAYNLFLIPRYRAATSMEMQGSQDSLASINLTSSGNVSIQTQVDLLKSRSLIDRVNSKMALDNNLEWQGRQDLLAPWRQALGVQSSWGLAAWQKAVGIAQGTLKITSKRDSNIVTLQCDSTNPQVAAEFLNGLTREYIQQRMDERWEEYQNTGKWLNQAQAELKAKAEASEEELQRYARTSGLLFTSDTENIAEEKLRQLQEQLSKSVAERIARQAQFEASKSSRPEALPEVLDSGPIGTYQVQLTELRRQLADLNSTLTPEHYKIKRLQAQISELETVVERERGNIIKRIGNEYEAALRTENQIRAEYDRQAGLISGQAEGLIKYRTLKREAEVNRQLYELTLQKGKEASINSALRASDARVIDAAMPAVAPYKPVLAMNLAGGMVGGLLFGLVFAIVLERLRATVHLPGNLSLLSSVRELGVIPSAKIDRLLYAKLKHSIAGASKRISLPADTSLLRLQRHELRKELSGNSLELVTWSYQPSVMAEAFRSTMASILFSSNSSTGRPQTIVITSALPSEGKTTIACNLSIALAEINQSVLIVDGDMRIPRLHNIFGVSNGWGLSDLLQDKTPIEEYPLDKLAHKTEIPNLCVLPSGSTRTSSSSLLYSPRLPEIFARCQSEFSVVIVDAPPVLNVPDARILSRAADFAVLVFRAAHTTRDEAAAALRCFGEDGTVVLGTILNDWNANSAGYGPYRAYASSYHYYGTGS
jgi:polysaccharide biosynthesis transport protein